MSPQCDNGVIAWRGGGETSDRCIGSFETGRMFRQRKKKLSLYVDCKIEEFARCRPSAVAAVAKDRDGEEKINLNEI